VYSRELCDLIFNQPYVRVSSVVEAKIAQRETASRRLRALAAAGFLEEMKVGREKLFLNKPFLALLGGRD
jgi:Fic family protein